MNKVAADRIAVVMKLTGVTPLQAAQLVKAASDRALKGRMEKDARFNPLPWMGRQASAVARNIPGLKRFYTTPGAPTGRFTPPMPGATPRMPPRGVDVGAAGWKPEFGPRQWSGARAAGSTALVGAGTLGAGHLYNDSQNTVGRSLNPITWFNPQSEEDVFNRNMGVYKGQNDAMQGQMNEALSKGDMGKYRQLQAQWNQGDFGASRWSLGGLNPFVQSRAKGYQDRAMGIQKDLQGKYNAEMGKVGPQAGDPELVKALEERLAGGDYLWPQEDALKQQLATVKSRMAAKPGTESPEAVAIRERMQRMAPQGMRFNPFKPPGATTAPQPGGTPYGNWHLGSRPRIPGGAQGFVMSPTDYRPAPSPDNYWGPATVG